MTVQKKDRYLVCRDVTTATELVDVCKEPAEPIIVVFPSDSFSVSEKEKAELQECKTLLVFAAKNINQYDFLSVVGFDLRLSMQYYEAAKIELSDEDLAKICGYHAVYERKEGTVKGFTTVLSEDEAFENQVETFIEKLISDKPAYHLWALADCFQSARFGDFQTVLEKESYHIVRLENKKAGGAF